ncbi:uncharacterized protein LOC124123129 isoform X2 [Haliotis rufescens]|uniref:uncharacterized protein LOC124123129 isoform X2 n=1 Tax=Haliotis rufescens TaxID=6454 RepID=UPI00201EF082|nr:uncharacterized protein LOC124123129 isoform X2 [Haliotis rufescens]
MDVMEYVDARDDDEYLAALANMGDLSDIDDDIRPSAWSPSFSECSDHTYATMDWGRPRVGRDRNVFKGCVLVSTLLEQYPRRFRTRAVAVKFSKRLFKDGLIRSIFGARTFEDSPQLFMWQDDEVIKRQHATIMTSSYPANHTPGYSVVQKEPRDRLDYKLVEDVKNKVLNRVDDYNIVSSFNNFIRELERDFPEASHGKKHEIQRYPPSTWDTGVKRESTCSTDSSVDTQTYFRLRDRNAFKYVHPMASTREHSAIPEERVLEKNEMAAIDYEMTPGIPGTINSHTSSGGTVESGESQRRWVEPSYSYSDNEKQLIEEMKRMKKEHQHILRTYEERINKLMAKMHELRSIAEMLENSSTKSSPYGILPAKASLLNIIGTKLEEERKQAVALLQDGEIPPPLPPRPSRGNKVYPNKPIIHPQVKMKPLHWHRIILTDVGSESGTVWHSMLEPKLDTEDIERLFSKTGDPSASDDVTLYDDIYFRRGRPKQQPVGIFDSDKSQRVTLEMKKLRHTLNDVIQSMSALDMSSLHKDGMADLLELIHAPRELDKILHHIKRKGASNLDCPEYLVFELSKVDHFRERIDFLRFKHRLQVNLFEIDQQLRELNTACEEITSSVALKNLLETLLAIGNYLNGGSAERGQADGFTLDILTKLKDSTDRTRRGNLLEFVMKTYVQQYENDLDLGCPTRFRLPEPSNMRHAAQVSFDDIHRVLGDLRGEVNAIRERIESLSKRESSNLTQTLRVNSDNFATCALEVVFEQERVLEDSRNRFLKTTSYFLHDNRKCTPHEFFQIWATFLHDCKYYWKLAHRNLARNKFELEFRSKSQLSSSSGQGFSSVKSKMLKHLSVLNDDKDMKANRAQHLKHINNWIESVGKYTQEMKPERPPLPREGEDNKEVARYTSQQQRSHSPSPKPMTSTPPNVHKPLAINKTSPETVEQVVKPVPAERTANYENQPRYVANYENQEQAYESLNKARMNNVRSVPSTAATPSTHAQEPKKNGPFSLKSWLKRDQRSDDEQIQSSVQNTTPAQQPKPTTSGNPFGKLRNTVVQKFSNSNSAKKSPESEGGRREREVSRDRWAQSDQESTERKHRDGRRSRRDEEKKRHEAEKRDKELRGHGVHGGHSGQAPPDPIQVFQDKLSRDYQNLNYESPVSRTSTHSGNQSVPSTLSSIRSRDQSPSKYEVARAARDRHGSGQRHVQPVSAFSDHPGASDENNNKNTAKVSPQSGSSYRTRDRAPIALGSNISISDAYTRAHDDLAPPGPPGPPDATDASVGHLSNVDSKWVKATAVPVYKAKLIPNYENQTKLDPRFDGPGVRGQAEPVVLSHHHQESTTSDDYRHILQRKSEMYVSPGYGTTQNMQKQMTPDPPRPSRSHKDSRRSVSAGNLPERQHHDHAHQQVDPPQPTHPSSDKRLDPRDQRGPAHAPSITSLIERFEKKPGDEGGLSRQLQENAWQATMGRSTELQGKPVSMSTPVSRRKNLGLYEDPQAPTPSRPDRGGRYSDHPSPAQASVTPYHSHNNAHYHSTPVSQYSTYHTPASEPPPKPAHTPHHAPGERNEAYTDQLRKVAKNSSVFDRYGKTNSPGYGRHNSPGAMAVVKPTMLHQGAVSFMEI